MVKQGGSQLAQLKSALHSAGLSRKSDAKSKKRKRGEVDGVAGREKQAARLQEITSKLNPFDLKVTKQKRLVPGAKVKGVTGRPAAAAQIGLEQRRKTLLVEYQQRGRVGGIVDRRYGENNPHLTAEEKMLKRFTHEKKKSSKVSYNLEDEEELTHYGQSLNALDDFERTGLALDEDEAAEEAEEEDHFGGFEEEENDDPDAPPRKKSKAEVMDDVMAKSKMYKRERQLQKEADDNLRHEVDQELRDIQHLLIGLPGLDLTSSNPHEDTADTEETLVAEEKSNKKQTGTDLEYDRLIRELVYDQRAKPTDRLKTAEEIAVEEKEKLEKAERARLRRMNGEGDYDSDDEQGPSRKKRKRAPQADDLDDDFAPEDDEPFLGEGLGADLDKSSAQSEDESENEDADGAFSGVPGAMGSGDEDDEDEQTSEEEGDDSLRGDLSESEPETALSGDEDALVQSNKIRVTSGSSKGRKKPPKKELPYTFACPENHDDFLDIVAGIDDEDIPTVVQRIRTLYHPSLAEGNKAKLEVLTIILIEHIIHAAGSSGNPFPLITSLSPQLFTLIKAYTGASARTFVAKLVIMQKNLTRGLSQPHDLGSRTFPRLPELVLLRLIGATWSTSDLWHPVVAPAMLLMGQYLSQGRVRSLADLASGLFLCTLFIQYQSLSRRLVPEAINFLLNACLFLAPHDLKRAELPGTFPAPDFDSSSLRSLQIDTSHLGSLVPKSPNLLEILREDESKGNVGQHKVDLLDTSFNLLGKFAELYSASESFIEMFDQVHALLSVLDISGYSEALEKRHSSTVDSIGRRLKFARQTRQPLRLQDHKPIAIASIAPKFDPNFGGWKSREERDDPASEAAKLKAMYKKEKKAAVRELRKDAKFLASEKARQQAEKDKEYNAKMVKAVSSISSERAEEKMADRMKKIAKLRAGKNKSGKK
ncbi:nucleolar complex protein 14 [Tulasnella sp. UAMH 9824]|nr:nucleolar complex protein 14 [Tulasnella sp. UAMH 9824]